MVTPLKACGAAPKLPANDVAGVVCGVVCGDSGVQNGLAGDAGLTHCGSGLTH